jgi:hypothetical protein
MFRWALYLPTGILLLLLLLIHLRMARWALASPGVQQRPDRRIWVVWAAVGLGALLVAGFAVGVPRVIQALPPGPWLAWLRATALMWALVSLGLFFGGVVWRRIPNFDPRRRQILQATGGALAAAPFVAAGFGVLIQRTDLRVRQVDLQLPGLPEDLEDLRLVLLSDIHLSPFLTEKELARAVAMANETKPHIALVTGDLITGRSDPLDACLQHLSRLRADAGILGCLGNHEIYARAEGQATEGGARLGIRFLRGEARPLRFGGALLNIAGVDYQRYRGPYLRGAEQLQREGALNLLLSHNPDVFPVAARQGWDLTLSGHTHGGQVNVEILNQSVNFARFYTPYVYGVYREASSAIYVTRGIGTVGIPARIGAPPEVALIRLCAT